jgi:hypothetical protein
VVPVANSDVLAAVSETLRSRLTQGLSDLGPPVPFAELHDLTTTPSASPPRATLFLYDVVEEPTSRNRPKSSELVGGVLEVRKQPLALRLHYMVTPWGGDRVTEQRILGRVLQVLYDDAVIDGAELQGVLAGTTAQLRVCLAPMRVDDRARVWFAIGQTYHLSVNYEVRVIDVDAERVSRAGPVVRRDVRTGVTA